MRKYLFNGAIISAVFGGISAFRSTKSGPRDWRTVLLWVSWATTMATAVGTVIMDARERERED